MKHTDRLAAVLTEILVTPVSIGFARSYSDISGRGRGEIRSCAVGPITKLWTLYATRQVWNWI